MPARNYNRQLFYRRVGKRLVDLAIAIPSLIVLSPLLLVVAVLVRIRLGAPVLFRQKRPGLHAELFTLLKFRTMTSAVDDCGVPLPDAVRMTTFGRLLRSSSLDELPELFNVVRGEMSLVGPRPLLTEYLGHYSSEHMRRHDAPPGITGWAQVNGRAELSWKRRFELDVWYVDHCSLWLDAKILVFTFLKILSQEGIGEPGQCEPFLGSSADTLSSAATQSLPHPLRLAR